MEFANVWILEMLLFKREFVVIWFINYYHLTVIFTNPRPQTGVCRGQWPSSKTRRADPRWKVTHTARWDTHTQTHTNTRAHTCAHTHTHTAIWVGQHRAVLSRLLVKCLLAILSCPPVHVYSFSELVNFWVFLVLLLTGFEKIKVMGILCFSRSSIFSWNKQLITVILCSTTYMNCITLSLD